ncbi:methyl-accepting chemotaxis protein [Reichenbachiella versicolor]|uniref:methyl-accepting chemotaxis protein n=1 Tax=Reichenbachiella versicolor TaxID=1821036 RepID=UPI000D6E5835|nr:methyl-accepting chemotaxis protein [Reichenbachiella versicolor]
MFILINTLATIALGVFSFLILSFSNRAKFSPKVSSAIHVLSLVILSGLTVMYFMDHYVFYAIWSSLLVIGAISIGRVNSLNNALPLINELKTLRKELGLQNLKYSKAEIAIQALANGVLDSTDFMQSHKLASSMTKIHSELNALKIETQEIVNKSTQKGHLYSKLDDTNKKGIWKELTEGRNQAFEKLSIPLAKFSTIVEAMSKGDLTARYQLDSDEKFVLADNLNKAIERIDGLLNQIAEYIFNIEEASQEVKSSSEEMNTHTSEIASAIAEMSQGAQTQLNKIDESSDLIEHMIRSSQQMGEKSNDILNAARTGSDRSKEGLNMISDLVGGMQKISNLSIETNESIHVLENRSKEIERMLKVISDIASQTNLLALNAAIEAAQAGEYGRGFAVVAEEIRSLAESSKESAREIERLVLDVKKDTKKAAAVIDTMNHQVSIENKKSIAMTSMFEDIHQISHNTLELSEDILEASDVQVKDINQIITLISEVLVIAEETATGTEQIATSATELSQGMDNFSDKSAKMAEIAHSLKEGFSMLNLSGDALGNTELLQMKEAYEKEKALMDALMESLPDRIYFKDEKSTFIRVSRSMLELFKVNNYDELIGKNTYDMLPKEYADKLFDDEKRIMSTGDGLINDIVNEQKEGNSVWVSTTKLPLRDSTGKAIGTFGITKDITDIKENELRMQDQLKDLEVQNQKMKEAEERLQELEISMLTEDKSKQGEERKNLESSKKN